MVQVKNLVNSKGFIKQEPTSSHMQSIRYHTFSVIHHSPVDDVQGMEVPDGAGDFRRVELGPDLREGLLPLQMKEELTTVDVVQDEVELVGRLEGVVETDQEWMLEVLQEDAPLGHDVFRLVGRIRGWDRKTGN